MRSIGYYGTARTVPASGIVTWSGDDIPSAGGLAALCFSASAAGGGLASLAVNLIRIKADGELVVDLAWDELIAFTEAWGSSHHNLGTAPQRYMVPFFLPDAPTPEDADICGFPYGAKCTVELFTGSSGAGTITIGWLKATRRPGVQPRLLGSAANIALSQTSRQYTLPLSRGDTLRAFSINNTGLTRLQAFLRGQMVVNVTGAKSTEGSLLTATGLFSGPLTNVNPVWTTVPFNVSASSDDAYLQVDTGDDWAGTANRIAVYSVRQQ
jgi:hypothetical protein